eukprot:TRINITY_DN3626_c0_g1_i2.p1 TRINITY_DN3626_c0_g1~~TRINITY_DN3626_c0_g1_i2.p1  ORF type:complete len:176 (+),score=25.24 TRINITY_DN3626_c0_g1_i2:101-628(+)
MDIVGLVVQLQTSQGETVEGEVFSFDPTSNCLVLQEDAAGGKKNFKILKINGVKDIKVLSRGTQDAMTTLPSINMSRVRMREEAALQQAVAESARIGVGVSSEAQEIFNALGKTLPVRWIQLQICVLDVLHINPPYMPEDVVSVIPGNEVMLNRVRKVLEGERRRLAKQAQQVPS